MSTETLPPPVHPLSALMQTIAGSGGGDCWEYLPCSEIPWIWGLLGNLAGVRIAGKEKHSVYAYRNSSLLSCSPSERSEANHSRIYALDSGGGEMQFAGNL